MKTNLRPTLQLGELVVVAFDWAARFSADPREVSRLATGAVRDLLRYAGRPGSHAPWAAGTARFAT